MTIVYLIIKLKLQYLQRKTYRIVFYLQKIFVHIAVFQRSKVKIVDVLNIPEEELLLETKKEGHQIFEDEYKFNEEMPDKESKKIKKIRKRIN